MSNQEALVQGLLNYPKPSELAIVQIPEIIRLQDVPQDPKFHPEGSAYIHSMEVLDRAAELLPQIPEFAKLTYMLAAWLHDVGKWEKTFYKDDRKKLTHWSRPRPKNTRIVSYGHECAGEELVPVILKRELPSNPIVVREVAQLVRNHMRPLLLQNSHLKIFRKMKENGLPLWALGMLNWADKGKRLDYWFRRIEELNEEKKRTSKQQ